MGLTKSPRVWGKLVAVNTVWPKFYRDNCLQMCLLGVTKNVKKQLKILGPCTLRLALNANLS